jgi:hypothetical protein
MVLVSELLSHLEHHKHKSPAFLELPKTPLSEQVWLLRMHLKLLPYQNEQ